MWCASPTGRATRRWRFSATSILHREKHENCFEPPGSRICDAFQEPPTGARGSKGAKASNSTASRRTAPRSEEHTSELQSLMRISYAVCCLTKHNTKATQHAEI